jgi:hypothetical protein
MVLLPTSVLVCSLADKQQQVSTAARAGAAGSTVASGHLHFGLVPCKGGSSNGSAWEDVSQHGVLNMHQQVAAWHEQQQCRWGCVMNMLTDCTAIASEPTDISMLQQSADISRQNYSACTPTQPVKAFAHPGKHVTLEQLGLAMAQPGQNAVPSSLKAHHAVPSCMPLAKLLVQGDFWACSRLHSSHKTAWQGWHPRCACRQGQGSKHNCANGWTSLTQNRQPKPYQITLVVATASLAPAALPHCTDSCNGTRKGVVGLTEFPHHGGTTASCRKADTSVVP